MQSSKNRESVEKQNLLPNGVQTWLTRLDGDGDKILVRRAYIDLCDGDPYAALIFSQLLYYYQPDKHGRSKLRVKKNGYWWIAKRYEDWDQECRVKPSTAKKKIGLLKRTGLVITCNARFNGLKTLHLRIDFECLDARRMTLGKRENCGKIGPNRSVGSVGSTMTDRSDLPYPNRQASSAGCLTESTAGKTFRAKEPPPLLAQGSEPSHFFPGNQNEEAAAATVVPVAAEPQVAADAAPQNLEKFNYARWMESAEFPEAQMLEALFPGDAPFSRNQDAARKYHQRVRTGMLPPKTVDLLLQYFGDTWMASGVKPACLDDLLRKDTLPTVLAACRDHVLQAIDDVNMDGENDDGTQHVLQNFHQARNLVTPESDMVEELGFYHYNRLGLLYAAYSRGASRIREAAEIHRDDIVEKISRWPSWTKVLGRYNEHLLDILGMTLEEVREHQRTYAENKEQKLSELRAYLR